MHRAGWSTRMALLALLIPACGAHQAEAALGGPGGMLDAPRAAPTASYEVDESGVAARDFDDSSGGKLAAAEPAPAQPMPLEPQQPPTASDAGPIRGPLLVYTASFQLSVFEVEKSQSEAKALALGMGGFVAMQSQSSITVRVPAAKFEQAVAAVERMGKVLSRQVEALDVGERYRDLGLRLKTLEAMRQRLEDLLARASNVKEALEVEQQLERVLGEIEQLKGQLRSLEDRIAYSTLTLSFTPTPQPALDQGAVFRLPFPWLEELGVHSLLEVNR